MMIDSSNDSTSSGMIISNQGDNDNDVVNVTRY